jgi:hypothetical protein
MPDAAKYDAKRVSSQTITARNANPEQEGHDKRAEMNPTEWRKPPAIPK